MGRIARIEAVVGGWAAASMLEGVRCGRVGERRGGMSLKPEGTLVNDAIRDIR